jgi:hypothetical protein
LETVIKEMLNMIWFGYLRYKHQKDFK